MEIILVIVQTLLISQFVVKFEPLTWIIDIIRLKVNKENIVMNLLVNILSLLISCFKCCALWMGLLIGGVWVGLASSYIAYLYTWLIEPRIEKYFIPTSLEHKFFDIDTRLSDIEKNKKQ